MTNSLYCQRCGKVTRHSNHKCLHCENEKQELEELALWDAQDSSEKLRDLNIRVRELEKERGLFIWPL